MGHEQPEWVEQLVLIFKSKATEAAGYAKKLDRKKYRDVIGVYNSEARTYEIAAEMLEGAWCSEAEVVATLYDELRTELEALLITHTLPVGVSLTNPGHSVVNTTEVPIGHSEVRLLLAKFPHRFPRLDEEELEF